MGGFEKCLEELWDGATSDRLLTYETSAQFYRDGNFLLSNTGVSRDEILKTRRVHPKADSIQKWKNSVDGKFYHHLHLSTLPQPTNTSVARFAATYKNKSKVIAVVMVEVDATPTAEDLHKAFDQSYNATEACKPVEINKK